VVGDGEYGVLHIWADGESEGETAPSGARSGRERVGGAGGVGTDLHARRVWVTGAWAGMCGKRGQRQFEDLDVVGGGVGTGLAGTQHAGQGFSAGDVGTVEIGQQWVEPEGLLPRFGRIFLVAVGDSDRGVDVDDQPGGQVGAGTRGPGPFPRSSTHLP
jgi:hypothetical protein